MVTREAYNYSKRREVGLIGYRNREMANRHSKSTQRTRAFLDGGSGPLTMRFPSASMNGGMLVRVR